ncbi:mu-type opioid receptor-like [Mercenaria mercenaria]|uniref:mu-type opioid receptor-like n=1 Tax=Mercenaria mercenaria TaxID=6596 RepID=UPI001E1DCE2B|nr:mu-type opioid receptor-like [Mercenaria mercenaria]
MLNMNNSSINVNVTSSNISEEDEKGLDGYQYSLFVANIVICLLNLTGNICVLVLICQRRLLGRTTNVFVFSLAMSDAICCVAAIPYNAMLALERDMSVYLCKGYFYALCISRTAVSYTVILLTTEKILNILHPSRFITAGRCMFFISLVWFFSVAYNVWTVVFYTIYDYDKITYIEYMMDSSKILYGKKCFFSHRFKALRGIFLTIDFVMLFILPCAIIAIEFCVILRKQHGTIKQRFETYYYIMRFIFFIFLVYIICHLPFEIGTLVKGGTRDPNEISGIFYEMSLTLYYTRGVLYLIVYMYFKQYVCRRSRRLNASNSGHQINRIYLELPVRGQCRGLSLNELRLMK